MPTLQPPVRTLPQIATHLAIIDQNQVDRPAGGWTWCLVWCAIGIALRLFVFVRNPPLWIDEAMLGMNILERDYAGLMEPLRLNQGAPLGYLFTLKFLSTFFGSSELALRLPSFVSSC
ncbi:MAG: hypothetical protein ACRCZF_01875, partial [Gemmataceae bacterium]